MRRTIIIVVVVLVVAAVLAVGVLAMCTGDENSTSSRRWAAELIESYYYEDVGEIDYRIMEIEEMVDAYLDRYSAYYTYDEYMSEYYSNAGVKAGIGVVVSNSPSGVVVSEVYGNSPAYKAGLRKGDVIEYLKRGSSSARINFDDASALVSILSTFSTDEVIHLYVADSDEPIDVSRAAFQASYVFMSTGAADFSVEYDDEGEASLCETPSVEHSYLPENAAYIQITEFYGNADTELGMMLEKFYELEMDTVILDLRNNGGGYMSVLQGMASYFIDEEDVVTYADYRNTSSDNVTEYYPTKTDVDVKVDPDTDIYVLANLGTASASEALIGMLVSYDFVPYENVFISSFSDDYLEYSGNSEKNGRTYGKGIMQQSFMNSRTGEVLKLTVATLYWPDGKKTCIHDRGLSEEDGCRLSEAAWTVTRGDEELKGVAKEIFGESGAGPN